MVVWLLLDEFTLTGDALKIDRDRAPQAITIVTKKHIGIDAHGHLKVVVINK
ncbi:MAG TPA: hypothetical protein VHN11_01005 [Xanthobacteraceae bacterium]|nr:hypothetical protein [Xanthobacteraceae bacterium]